MHPYQLQFAASHTLSYALATLLEGDTLEAVTADDCARGGNQPLTASPRGGFAGYGYLDAAERNRQFARAMLSAARKAELNSSLPTTRRIIEAHRLVQQLGRLRETLDVHCVPYDFFASEALMYAMQRAIQHAPHLSEISAPDALAHVVSRWNDPEVRSCYPLRLAHWDKRFQHKRRAGTPEHRAMYEVIQQRVADVIAIGGDPVEALRPSLGRFIPVDEAIVRFGRELTESAQRPPSIVPDDPTESDPSPAGDHTRRRRPAPRPKQDVIAWAKENAPDLLAEVVRKELAARSRPPKQRRQPRDKSARQRAEARQRAQELDRARCITDLDARRIAVDGWVRTWITRSALQVESSVAPTAWAGYRHLSPLERTELFNQRYIEVYRAMHTKYIDPEVGPRKQPLAPQYGRNGLQVMRCLWKARVLADAVGLPYDMYLSAVMERKLANGKWTHAGRPNQLFSDLDLACARGLIGSGGVPDVDAVATDRPSCYGYAHLSDGSPCTTCTVRVACEAHVGLTLACLQVETGTDDPQLQRKRAQDAARARDYRKRAKIAG